MGGQPDKKEESCAALGEIPGSGLLGSQIKSPGKLSCSTPGFILLSGAGWQLLRLKGAGKTVGRGDEGMHSEGEAEAREVLGGVGFGRLVGDLA